ncbi:hypothetical protein H0H81_001793 [Sphagnurus paluster]|uniref:Uncharacterized protein n=1 Tax=Sphagnurus paluster TaxID=117069 RepID=A0A9P7K6N9_9AGAR|nr:hypothetical protein H0H81_001793 [Sphagnurus paluster]
MEISNIPNQGFHPNDQSVPTVEQQQQQQQNPSPTPTSNQEIPQKRKPGRPKGSSKKNLTGETLPKLKRPVGRPRKDGFPAGSLGPSRPRLKPPMNGSASWAGSMSGVAYPQYASASMVHVPIDPNLQQEDWAALSRTNPNSFLTTLLSALAAPNPVSSAGPTVEEAFKSHLNSLTPMTNQLQPIPSLYSILKTFWLPSSPAYFSLTASASTARTPSEHRFLYWDPQPLVFNGLACPHCAAALLNRGRISSGPIKIYDIERPFFIIGCEYVCRSQTCTSAAHPEGRRFASTDASIFRALPVKLKDEFPARLMYADVDAGCGPNIWNWGALGVSLSLWNMVRGCLRMGMRRDAILQLVNAVQHGVPEDELMGDDSMSPEHQKTEEDEGDGEAEGDGDGDEAGPSGEAGSTAQDATSEIPNAFFQTFIEAYNDAWNANNGASGSAPQNGRPSTSQAEASTSGSNNSVTQPKSTPQQTFEHGKGFAGYPYAAYAFFPPPAESASAGVKRPFPYQEEAATSGDTSKRSPRHCCKCGSQDCKGKGGRSFCTNGCQDCGKLECKGRNSRRPDKKCSEGWL